MSYSVTPDRLYRFIVSNAEEIGGLLVCRASIAAQLKAWGITGNVHQTRIKLVRELEERGLVVRPHPQSRWLVLLDEGGAQKDLTSHPHLTRKRVAKLQAYMRTKVLTGDKKFICASKKDCKGSIAPNCSFQDPHLSHVGTNFDLQRDGKPLRIVVVGQEVGNAKRLRVGMKERSEVIRASAYDMRFIKEGPCPLRNPHMRGTTLALRTILGVPGLDHASEFLELNRLRVHLFDCFALVNRLLCSAHVSGTSNGKSTSTMLMNCERHFGRTLRILEPTIVVIQGVRMWEWSQDVLVPRRQVTPHLVEAELVDQKVIVANLTHPSAIGKHRWDSPVSPYFKAVVRPTLKRAVAAI